MVHCTSYLWEWVCRRDAWPNLVALFLHVGMLGEGSKAEKCRNTRVISRASTSGTRCSGWRRMRESVVCSERLKPRFFWLLFKTVAQQHSDSLTANPVPPLGEQQIIEVAERARECAERSTRLLARQVWGGAILP